MATHVPAAWKPPWVPTDLFAKLPSKSNVFISLGNKNKKRKEESINLCEVVYLHLITAVVKNVPEH